MKTTYLIGTQYNEKYGEGYWKPKGGNEMIITAPTEELAIQEAKKHLINSQYAHEYIIGTEIVDPDYKTWLEKSQLEYEGVITYPALRVEV